MQACSKSSNTKATMTLRYDGPIYIVHAGHGTNATV